MLADYTRTLADLPEDDAFQSTSGLEIKIALGNYRIFYTPDTEDYFYRPVPKTPAQRAEEEAKEITDNEEGLKKLEGFVQKKLGVTGAAAGGGDKMDVDPVSAVAATTTSTAPANPAAR